MKLSYPLGTADSGPMEGKWFPFGVGIDCHKDMVWVCVLQPNYDTHKQERSRGKVGTDATDLQPPVFAPLMKKPFFTSHKSAHGWALG